MPELPWRSAFIPGIFLFHLVGALGGTFIPGILLFGLVGALGGAFIPGIFLWGLFFLFVTNIHHSCSVVSHCWLLMFYCCLSLIFTIVVLVLVIVLYFCFCQAQPQLKLQLWLRLALISISPHHPYPPDRKSRKYNFLGPPHLQFQLKLTSKDILTKLLI